MNELTPEETTPQSHSDIAGKTSAVVKQSQYFANQSTAVPHDQQLVPKTALLSCPDEILALVIEKVIIDENSMVDACCERHLCTCRMRFQSNSRSLLQSNRRLNALVQTYFFKQANVRVTGTEWFGGPGHRRRRFGVGNRGTRMERILSFQRFIMEIGSGMPIRPQPIMQSSQVSLRPRCELIRLLEFSVGQGVSTSHFWSRITPRARDHALAHFPELRELVFRFCDHDEEISEAVFFNDYIDWSRLHADCDPTEEALWGIVTLLHEFVAASPKLRRIKVDRNLDTATQEIIKHKAFKALRALDSTAYADAALEGLAMTFIDKRAQLPLRQSQLESISAKVFARIREYRGTWR